MQVTPSQLITQQAKIWTGFLLYAVRRFWWLIAVSTTFGLVWGYFSSMTTPNVYESTASFLIPGEDVLIEYERLLSRSLVTKYIAQDKRFEVAYFVHHGWRPRTELYSRSPFQMRVVAFPEHLKDRPHEIKLLDSTHFEITVHAQKEQVVAKGEVGVMLEIGSARLLIDATAFWNKEAPGYQYSFVVQSQEALATRVMRKLSLEHSTQHPNRISLHYADHNPQLAFDVLDAFTQGYLKERKYQREQLLRERQSAVLGELKSLEVKMLASDDAEFWTALAQKNLIAQDSSIVDWLELRRDMERIQKRQKLWIEFQKGRLLPEALGEELKKSNMRAEDSTLLSLIGQYAVAGANERNTFSKAINAMVDSLDRKDAALMKDMDGSVIDVNAGMMGSRVLASEWLKRMAREDHSAKPLLFILLERYLAGLDEASKIELDTRKESEVAQLIDPPYMIAGHGRGLKIRKWAAWILGMGMLGLAASLLLGISGKRFGSIFHFQSISGVEQVAQWTIGGPDNRHRIQTAYMELSLKPEDKVIALIGESPYVDRLADSMALGFVAYDRRVLVLNSILDHKEAAWEHLVVPASTRPGWWFSPAATAMIQEKAAQYDRIILCLPPLAAAPEIVAATRLAQAVLFVVQSRHTKVSEWREWDTLAKELDLQSKAIFVSQATKQ